MNFPRGEQGSEDEKRERDQGSGNDNQLGAQSDANLALALSQQSMLSASIQHRRNILNDTSALESLQFLRQRQNHRTAMDTAALNLANLGAISSALSNMQAQPQTQSLLREAQENSLRESNIRLLTQQLRLQQQQQNQQSMLPQLGNPSNAAHTLSNQNFHLSSLFSQAPAPANQQQMLATLRLQAQLGLVDVGSLGGLPPSGRHNFSASLAGVSNANNLLRLQQGRSLFPRSSLVSNTSMQTLQHASLGVQASIPFARPLTGGGEPPTAAALPASRPQPQPAEEQQEMKDEEYFELFGFNDEDAVQIINETFPHKLYRMLFEVERNGQEGIVSWFPHGKAFIVKQPKQFVAELSSQYLLINSWKPYTEAIMPRYFSTNRMSSFQRQLNLYGFQRIDDGPEKGGFLHEHFQKGKRSSCNLIRRQRHRASSNSPSVTAGETTSAAGSLSALGGAHQPQGNLGLARADPSNNLPWQPAAAAASASAQQSGLSQSQQAQALFRRMLSENQEQSKKDQDRT